MLDVDRADITEIGKSRDVNEWLKAHALLQADTLDVAQHIATGRVGAMTSVWLLDVLDASLARYGPLAERFVELVSALPDRARLECCEQVKLPLSVRRFGDDAAPILRMLIEDRVLRPFFADRAARLWLELDLQDAALPAALGITDEVTSMTLLHLAQRVDPDEAFEFLAARFERDAFFLELLSRSRIVAGVDRFVPLALARLHEDPMNAARLLAQVGTARALDELKGVLHAADHVSPTALAVVSASSWLPDADAVDVFAFLLGLPFAAALHDHHDARGTLAQHAHALFAALPARSPERRVLDAILGPVTTAPSRVPSWRNRLG